jgi:heme-degrading monooxygenase HmoA
MIARTWHGVVPESKSGEYYEYLKKTGVTDYNRAEGNKGVFVLRRTERGQTHYLLLTLWENVDSIRKFSGNDIEKARYYPEDRDFLIELEPNVIHYEVLLSG